MKVALALFVISLAGILGLIAYMSYEPSKGGDFTLSSNGQEWNFNRQAKKLNLLYVGYAKCPDVCPMTLAYAGAAFRKLNPDQLKNVQMIFLSVDHAHDTPQAVHEYAQQFFPDFIGLTGTQQQIDFAVQQVGASYMFEEDKKSFLGYSIIHSDRVFFLNSKGKVMHSELSVRSEEQILNKIKDYL